MVLGGTLRRGPAVLRCCCSLAWLPHRGGEQPMSMKPDDCDRCKANEMGLESTSTHTYTGTCQGEGPPSPELVEYVRQRLR